MKTNPDVRQLTTHTSSDRTEETKKKNKVERWLTSSPKNRKMLDKLQNMWEWSERTDNKWDTERAAKRFAAMMGGSAGPPQTGDGVRLFRIDPKPPVARIRLKTFSQIAAALVLLAGISYVVQRLRQSALQKEILDGNKNFVIEEVSTKPGQQVSLNFDDGTKVVLNSASHLRYSATPNGSRNVYLQGEAFFAVVHSRAHPFIVHVGNEIIKDVGTKFDVSAWSDGANTRIAVVDGIVSVRPDSRTRKGIVVLRNQYCVIDSVGVITPPTRANVSWYTDWMKGELVFHGAPLSEVFRQIWRRFGVHCVVNDRSILSKRLTTIFRHRDPPQRVLRMIAVSLNLGYRSVSTDSVEFIDLRSIQVHSDTRGAAIGS